MNDQFDDLADRFARLSLNELATIKCQFCHDGTFFEPRHLTFPTEAAKFDHMESVHSACRPCKMYFDGEGFRQLHWETAPEHLHDYCRFHKKLVECAKNQSLKEQWRKHFEAEHFPCGDPCKEIFDTERELNLHRINRHWRRICPFCGASFKPSEALRWDVHMNSKHYWCKTCVLAFSSETERKDHYATSLEHSLTYCDICDHHYRDAPSFLQHHCAVHDYAGYGYREEDPEDQNGMFNQQGHGWGNNQRGQPSGSNQGGFERTSFQESHERRSYQQDPGWRYSTDGQHSRPREPDEGWRYNKRRHWWESTGHGDDGVFEPEDPWGRWQEFYESEHGPQDSETQQHRKRPPEDKQEPSKSKFWQKRHPRGENFKKEQYGNEQYGNEYPREKQYSNKQHSEDWRPPPAKPKGHFPNHYATLKVSRDLSQEDVEKAAKKRRIDVHPDKLAKLTNLSPEERAKKEAEAKDVGCAADILSNAESRRKYDRQLREWEAS